MKKITILFLGFALAYNLSAQIDGKIYGTPAQLKNLTNRTLVVELMEEDPEEIAKMEKNKKKPNAVADYRKFIASYNAGIQDLVKKYWKLNTNIEFKVASEVEALAKAKNTKYAVMQYFVQMDKGGTDFSYWDLGVPTLTYTGAENVTKRPDYNFYLPKAHTEGSGLAYYDTDFIFTLRLMQHHLNSIIKNNKTTTVVDYVKELNETSCSKLASYTILIDKDIVKEKFSESDLKSEYSGALQVTDAATIANAILNGKEKTAQALLMPWAIADSGVSAGVLTLKVVVDVKTGEMLAVTGFIKMGGNIDNAYWPVHFKQLSECKIK